MAARSQFIQLLFDPKSQRILGRGAQWMSIADFAAKPPAKIEDVIPENRDPKNDQPVGPDPGGRYECRNGVLYLCIDDPAGGFAEMCFPIGSC